MNMHAATIKLQLELCARVFEKNVGDVSHEESLAVSEQGGSCLNWVVGHMTRTRNLALASFNQKPPYPMQDFDAYDDRGGLEFTRETALPIDELRRRYKAMQEPLVRAIEGMPPEVLAGRPPKNMTGDPNETVGSNLVTFVFHEVTTSGKPECCGG